MQLATLREQLADAAKFQKLIEGKGGKDDKWVTTTPPQPVVNAIHARGEWAGIPAITDVVECPVMRPDGTVLQTPGFDIDTGIFYWASMPFPPVPDAPSQADAMQAAGDLINVVDDFPFKTTDHAVAWMTGVLTMLSRNAFTGPAPLILVDGNAAGTGKGLLCDCASTIHTGRDFPKQGNPETDDEMRKRITSIAIAGLGQALLDDVSFLGGSALQAALTGTSWQDRILGKSQITDDMPLRVCWWSTGNNVVLRGDMPRRVLHVRLESMEESPEERSGFTHPNLLEWVRENRGTLVVAALTILRGYVAAGRPDQQLKPWGSYEAWSALVRAAIVWAGLPDPGNTRQELRKRSDEKADILRRLIDGWQEVDTDGNGLTVAKMREHLAQHPQHFETLRTALEDLAPGRGGKPATNRSVGMKLRALQLKVVAGKYLDSTDDRMGQLWSVQEARLRD